MEIDRDLILKRQNIMIESKALKLATELRGQQLNKERSEFKQNT